MEGGRWKVESAGGSIRHAPCALPSTENQEPRIKNQEPISCSTHHPDTPILPYSHTSPLMLIPGPRALDWRRRKWGILPRLDNAALTLVNPPTPRRADLWARQHVHVRGRPEWVFVKVHTHGCVAGNMEVLLGPAMKQFHDHLRARFNDGKEWVLHYVTAREMYNVVRAAEDGLGGNPGEYRDYEILPPSGVE